MKKSQLDKLIREEISKVVKEDQVDYDSILNKIFDLWEKYGGDKGDEDEIEVKKAKKGKEKIYWIVYRGRMSLYLEKFEKEVENYLKSTNLKFDFNTDAGVINIYIK